MSLTKNFQEQIRYCKKYSLLRAKIDFDNYNLENDSIVVVAQSNEYFSF